MKTLSLLLALCVVVASRAQNFGGEQVKVDAMPCSAKYLDVNYADDGNAYHTMDIYLPEARADKYPVVVHVYGSAWFSNDSKGHAELGTVCTALLKAGYAVVCPNHRSSGDAKWPAQIHDIKAVVRYVRANAKRYGFDTRFIATSGFSSGGHLSALMAATSGTKKATVQQTTVDVEGRVGSHLGKSSRVDAAVSWAGPIALEAMDCGGRPNGAAGSPEEALVGVPYSEETAAAYYSVSPTSYAGRRNPPLLGFHGTKDDVVPHCQAEAWLEMYTKAGVRCELVTVEGAGHGGNLFAEDNLRSMVAFLDRVRSEKCGHATRRH